MDYEKSGELPEWTKLVLAVINGEWDWEDEAQRRFELAEKKGTISPLLGENRKAY
jgi:hypothetical protein